MSLWRYARAIDRAVAGELSPAREARLRAHLRTCDACRRRYDALSLLAGGRIAESRARARLAEALGSAEAPPAPPRRRLVWVLAPTFAAAAVVALVVARREPTDDVVWRGTSAAARSDLVVAFYGAPKVGGDTKAVRLLGELPASGEVHVPRAAWLQLAARRSDREGWLRIVGTDANGLRTLVPAEGSSPVRIARSDRTQSLGPSVDTEGLGAERLQLTALFASSPEALPALHSAEDLTRLRRQLPAGITVIDLGVVLVERQAPP